MRESPGTIEEVSSKLFTTASARPHYLAGVVSHGVYATGPFSVVHAGLGSIHVGPAGPLNEIRKPGDNQVVPSSKYLLNALGESSALSVSMVPGTELLYMQLEKLAVNAVINPLTTIFNCLNGELFNRPWIVALIRCLLAEILPCHTVHPSTHSRLRCGSIKRCAILGNGIGTDSGGCRI